MNCEVTSRKSADTVIVAAAGLAVSDRRASFRMVSNEFSRITLAASCHRSTRASAPNRSLAPEEGVMNTQRFDAMASRLGTANTRRRAVTALLAVMGSTGFRGSPETMVEAGHRHRKRHKKPSAQCDASTPCPPEAPCCFKGTCHPLCGGTCCEECFAPILLQTGLPDLAHPVCCMEGVGTVCSPDGGTKKKHKKGRKKSKSKDDPANDLCCYPNETCVNGVCCCNGCQGTMVCGDTCCAIASCCNGKCCENGEVCATTPTGPACVSPNRGCSGDQDCYADEVCHGGVCCSGNRICGSILNGGDVCCDAGSRCELPNNICCPNGTFCSSYRGHRVRV
jgi:hypothetical protein